MQCILRGNHHRSVEKANRAIPEEMTEKAVDVLTIILAMKFIISILLSYFMTNCSLLMYLIHVIQQSLKDTESE